MNNPPSKPWAKLLANNSEKQNLLLSNQSEELYEGQIKTGCQIYQKSIGDAWIKNISASTVKINDDWLELSEEKEIYSGERISFNKDKENDDENFDYVFVLMNSPSKNVNKRNREESLEPLIFPSNQETIKLTKVSDDIEKELTCSICLKIFHNCATLFPCPHTFCSWCILSSFKSSVRCPLCRIEPTSITKNLVAQNLVESFLKNFPDKGRPKEEIEQKQNELEGTIVKRDNWTHIGTYNNEKREGKGNMIYPNGDIYEGIWENDKAEGKGILTVKSGQVYKGQWLKDVVQKIDEIIFPKDGVYKGEVRGFRAHGKGVFKFYNGDIYDGNFSEGFRQGFGIYIYNDGAKYEGEWKGGLKDGSGTLKYSNGDTYKGEWKKDKREGKGVIEFKAGRKYDGFYKNDVYNGLGKYTWANGSEYEGNFNDGKRNGSGTFRYSNGDIYTGNWKDGEKEGDGVLTFPNGDKYQGIWRKNILQSVEKVYYVNGDTYEGGIRLKRFQRQGKGVLTFKNGDKYEGEWKRDKQHGNGREICRNGERIYEGVWKEGKISEVIMTDSNGKRYRVEWKEIEE